MITRQVSLWDVDDTTEFGSVADMTVGPVEQFDVREFCRRWHYTKYLGVGAANWPYGLFDGPTLVGVVAYNLPSVTAAGAVFGAEHAVRVAHMTRLACAEDAPRNSESRLIGGSLRMLSEDKPSMWAVVTYAARDVGHVGYVYQATNAIYTGISSAKPYYIDRQGRRRGATNSDGPGGPARIKMAAQAGGWTLHASPGKHRYVYILGTPAERRARRKLLKLPSLPYPKDGAR